MGGGCPSRACAAQGSAAQRAWRALTCSHTSGSTTALHRRHVQACWRRRTPRTGRPWPDRRTGCSSWWVGGSEWVGGEGGGAERGGCAATVASGVGRRGVPACRSARPTPPLPSPALPPGVDGPQRQPGGGGGDVPHAEPAGTAQVTHTGAWVALQSGQARLRSHALHCLFTGCACVRTEAPPRAALLSAHIKSSSLPPLVAAPRWPTLWSTTT